MPELIVEELERNKEQARFRVQVIEGASRTLHEVTLKSADFHKLADGKVAMKSLVQASFEFLLEREPKEAILSEFDLSIIQRYFPEFPKKIGAFLGGKKQPPLNPNHKRR